MKHKLSVSLTLALILAMLVTTLALADNVENNVVSLPASITLQAGIASSYVDVQFWIQPTSNDGDPQCNFDTSAEQLTFTINTPSGVLATPSSLTFNKCKEGGNNNAQTVRFAASALATPGNISFTTTFNNSGGSFNYNNAVFYVNVVPGDATPPVISYALTGTMGDNSWYTTDVFVDWTVTDPESAYTIDSGCVATTIDYDTAGITLGCAATSTGGTNSQSVTIKRDATPPSISGSAAPAPNGAGWNNTDVTVSFSCSDGMSGVASCGPNQTLSSEGAGQSATGTAADNAGNSASTTVGGINIDKTAPTVNASVSPVANANGWNNTNVTVTFSSSDGLSGIASCDAPIVLNSEGASQSASGSCTDLAGNSASATASGINIDKTPPTFGACPAGGPFLLNSGLQPVGPISVDASISGLNAGASTLSGSVDTSSIGLKTITFTAVDNADNSSTKSCSYSVIYNWTGFFRPVDNLPIWNKVKAGSAIPVKFSLSGNQGLAIFAAGYPKSQVIACDATAPVDGIEETVTAGGSSLSYDALVDQYVYVWKTEKSWTGCRQLVVRLIDGMEYRANFNFTK